MHGAERTYSTVVSALHDHLGGDHRLIMIFKLPNALIGGLLNVFFQNHVD